MERTRICLETPRLILRPFSPDDWRDLYAYLSDPQVVRYEPYDVFTPEKARREAEKRSHSRDFIALYHKEEKKVIGNLYFSPDEYDTYELGYVLSRAHWKQGYMTEAARALLDYAFTTLPIHRVIALCDPRNTASWRLMERLNMRREGSFIENVWFEQDETGAPIWKNTYQYAILKKEWMQNGSENI